MRGQAPAAGLRADGRAKGGVTGGGSDRVLTARRRGSRVTTCPADRRRPRPAQSGDARSPDRLDFLDSKLRVAHGRTKGRTAGRRWVPQPPDLLDEIGALKAPEDRDALNPVPVVQLTRDPVTGASA